MKPRAQAGLAMLMLMGWPLPAHAAAPPRLDPGFCQALIQHRPAPDVAYQPGVDVHGRAVAPADLPNSAGAQPPMPFSIPLTLDLAQFLKMKTDAFPFNAMGRDDINLGTLTIKDGQVRLGDQPLTDAQQDRLAVLCLEPSKAR